MGGSGATVSAGAVQALLERHGLLARRDLGQNFLVDEQLAARLAKIARVDAGDTVIEIGTGLGVLTRALAARARAVVSIEVDRGLVRALRAEAALPENVELVHADALEVDLGRLAEQAGGPVRVVANLPYSVASVLLRRLLDLRAQLVDWSVMLQREMAERVLAAPGSRDYGSLAVLHRLAARAHRELNLPAACFYPVPRVRSSFVRLEPREGAPGAAELAGVEQLARAAFAHRRKTLVNSLRTAGFAAGAADVERALAGLRIPARARAETLEPAQFRALAGALGGGRATPGAI